MKIKRDRTILKLIIDYCNQIEETQRFFGRSLDTFRSSGIYRNAVSLCILQIGELSGQLTEEFKNAHSGVPWRNIKGLRNIMAHRYGNIDFLIVWETITDDIPQLKDYCSSLLEQDVDE